MAIYALISQFQTQRVNDGEPGTYGIACNQILALCASLNSSRLRLKAEVRPTWRFSSALSIELFASDPATCRGLMNASDGLDHVGGSMLICWSNTTAFGGPSMKWHLRMYCIPTPENGVQVWRLKIRKTAYLLAIRCMHTRTTEMRSRYFNKGTRFIIIAQVHTFTMLLQTKGDDELPTHGSMTDTRHMPDSLFVSA